MRYNKVCFFNNYSVIMPSQAPIPVVLMLYRRPAATAQALAAIRAYRPARLILIADGPHSDRPGEHEQVAAARAAAEAIDWPCAVTRHYAERHLGLRARVESGLNAVFAAHEAAIILEDDCIADPSFFAYCAELLTYYANDPRVMAVSGDHFQPQPYTAAGYYFSRYPHCWGWATWRRAWQHYDGAMRDWPALCETAWLADLLGNRRAAQVWTTIFGRVYAGQIDSWAFRWTYSCWRAGGLTALPAVNLVRNIGDGLDATHTARSPFTNRPAQSLALPLRHPPDVVRYRRADAYTQRAMFDPPLWRRMAWRLRRLLG
jgi:hypothetical protein